MVIAVLATLKKLLLNEWDPIGVRSIPEAVDEYDAYALQLHIQLIGGASVDAVADYLNWVITKRMELVGDVGRDREIAERIFAIYHEVG